MTRPSLKACRNLAGRVRRFLSSIVCSYWPRSISLGLDYITTLPHFKPPCPTCLPSCPPFGTAHRPVRATESVEPGVPQLGRTGRVRGQLRRVWAAPRQDGRAAAGGEGDRLVTAVAAREREGEAGSEGVARAVCVHDRPGKRA